MTVTSFYRENLQAFISQQEASQPLSQRRVVVLCAANVCSEMGVLVALPYGTKRLPLFYTLAGRR